MEGSREITEHVRETECCNQRGGQFLSIVYLLDAGTVDLEIASLLWAEDFTDLTVEGHKFKLALLLDVYDHYLLSGGCCGSTC